MSVKTTYSYASTPMVYSHGVIQTAQIARPYGGYQAPVVMEKCKQLGIFKVASNTKQCQRIGSVI